MGISSEIEAEKRILELRKQLLSIIIFITM